MTMAQETDMEKNTVRKESILGLAIALLVLSIIALGVGWLVAEQLNTQATVATVQQVQESEEKTGSGEQPSLPKQNAILLDPIIIALHRSENTFMRLELALIPEVGSDIDNQETRLRIASEIAAFVQTLTLLQISGPTGYMHFREDILDRARLTTNGKIKDVLIMSLVAE
jgi:flagellar FliL protein